MSNDHREARTAWAHLQAVARFVKQRRTRLRLATCNGAALIAILTAALLVIPLRVGASPVATVRVVYPTGEHPRDVENVQAAVSAGGTILLKATDTARNPIAFNFGPADSDANSLGRVTLEKDVVILGETDNHGRTTIAGGVLPFFGVRPTKTTITGIHFDGPLLSAMTFISSSGAVISRNRITNVVGLDLGEPSGHLTEGRGIKFLGNDGPDRITGKIIVADNELSDLTADLSDAIVFDSVVNATIVIHANRIRNVEASGILLLNMGGGVSVTGNDIAPGPGLISPWSTGNGVYFVVGSPGRFTIQNNLIRASNPWADGILVWSSSSSDVVERLRIASNSVEMEGSYFGGITLIGNVTEAIVTLNRVSGTADVGIDLLAGDGAPAWNSVIGNNTSDFEAATADVYLDEGTTKNLVIGHDFTSVDLGTGNFVFDTAAGR